MIFVWLIIWALSGLPGVHPWNAWFITLIVSIVLA